MTGKNQEKNEATARIIVGAFIFNDKNELFLMKSPKWHDEYICPGGHVELNESLLDALQREIKEETNLDLVDVQLVGVNEGLELVQKYPDSDDHHVYINYKARVNNDTDIKLNHEATKYKWKSVADWQKDKKVKTSVKELLDKLDVEDYEGRYKRALADYQNLLKQSAKEKQEFAKYANEGLLHQLIPVYDNLKTSLQHTDEKIEASPWLEGIKYVIKQFADALRETGVEEIETIGKKFDHHTMEAVAGEGNKVSKELRPGYKLNGKVIAHAKVELEK